MHLRTPFISISVGILALSLACGGGSKSEPPPPSTVQVTASPAQKTLLPRNSYRFQATVSNTSNQAVAWSVLESGGGTVDSMGNYTAPDSGGPYHVVATALADSTKTAQATVTLAGSSSITVALNALEATLGTGQQRSFQATVTGDPDDQGVAWSLAEPGGGTVDAEGFYTAPVTPGTYHLLATSKADTTRCDRATIRVLPITAPATDLVYLAPIDDPAQWRLVPISQVLLPWWNGDLTCPDPGEIFLEIHAPVGTLGRGFALNFIGDSQNLEWAFDTCYFMLQAGGDTSYVFTQLENGTSTGGFFSRGSAPINTWDPSTGTLSAVLEYPIEGMVGLLALRLKNGATATIGQSLTFQLSKAGVLTKNGTMSSSAPIQVGTLKAIVR